MYVRVQGGGHHSPGLSTSGQSIAGRLYQTCDSGHPALRNEAREVGSSCSVFTQGPAVVFLPWPNSDGIVGNCDFPGPRVLRSGGGNMKQDSVQGSAVENQREMNEWDPGI